MVEVYSKSYDVGYLDSKISLHFKSKSEKLPVEHTISLNMSNLPDLNCLKEGKFCLRFKGELPSMSLNAPLKGAVFASQDAGKNKISIEKVDVNGAFEYPSTLSLKLLPKFVQGEGDILKVENLWAELISVPKKTVLKISSDKLSFDAMMIKVAGKEILINFQYDESASKNASLSWKVTLDSPLLKLPGGLKAKGDVNILNLPLKKLDGTDAENFFAHGTNGSFTVDLAASSSTIAANGKFHFEKESAKPYGVVKGSINLNFPEEDQKIQLIQIFYAALREPLQVLQQEHGLKLGSGNIEIPYVVKNKDLFFNDVRYFNCQIERGRPFSPSGIKYLSRERIMANAFDGLLWNRYGSTSGSAFCSLKYLSEVMHPTDDMGRALLAMFQFKKDYMTFAYQEEKLKARETEVVELVKKVNDPDLSILADNLHCLVDISGRACNSKKMLQVVLAEDQGLKRLIGLHLQEGVTREHLDALPAYDDVSEPYKPVYAFFRINIINKFRKSKQIAPDEKKYIDGLLAYDKMQLQCGEESLGCLAIADDGKTILSSDLIRNNLFPSLPVSSNRMQNSFTQPADDLLWSETPEGRKLYVSKAAEKGFNYSEIPKWKNITGLCPGPCPDQYHVDASAMNAQKEVHVVGVYEQNNPIGPDGKPSSTGILVKVGKSLKPVILFLTSYESVKWTVEATSGTKVEAVYLMSYTPSKVDVPTGTLVKELPEKHYGFEFEGREGDGGSGKKTFETAVRITGVKPLSFQGAYRGVQFSIPFYRDAKVFDEISAVHKQNLAKKTVSTALQPYLRVSNGQVEMVGKTVPGLPFRTDKIWNATYSEVNGKYYGLNSHGFFELDPKTASQKEIKPPAGYPRFSWLGGVTYDPRSKRLLIASTWHAGHHHSWDPVKDDWKVYDISKTLGSIHGITYDKKTDALYALCPGQLIKIDSEYNKLSHLKLPIADVISVGRGRAQLTSSGDKLVAIIAEDDHGRPKGENKIYLVDPNSGDLQLVK